MASVALKVLLSVYIPYSPRKFFDFFHSSYEKRISGIKKGYENDGRITRIYDNVSLLIVALMVVLLLVSGAQYLSFLTGLLAGMTLIQVYFHRFDRRKVTGTARVGDQAHVLCDTGQPRTRLAGTRLHHRAADLGPVHARYARRRAAVNPPPRTDRR